LISRRQGFFQEAVRSLRDCLKAAEEALERQQVELDRRFKQLAAQLAAQSTDPEEADQALEPLRDESWEMEEVFSQIQRKAFTAGALGVMEHQLNGLCNALAMRANLPDRVTDLSGKGIYRARKFLVDVIGLDLSDVDKEWQELNRAQKVRNVIVHADGELVGADADLLSYIMKSPHLEIDGSPDAVKLTATFPLHALEAAERFILAIFAKTVRPNTPLTVPGQN